jgi:hypothetical protein
MAKSEDQRDTRVGVAPNNNFSKGINKIDTSSGKIIKTLDPKASDQLAGRL